MSKLSEIQRINSALLLPTLNELEKVVSKIRNAVREAEQLELLNVGNTEQTINRLHGEILEISSQVTEILDYGEPE